MLWAADRPLGWVDFSGQPPRSTEWSALSFTGMRYVYRCDEQRLEFGVVAYFEPPQSWVKPGTARNRRSSAQVLPHEQGHFDIAEISARLLREQLTSLSVPCETMDSSFTALGNAALARAEALQNRYDAETVHGTFAPGQAQWRDWIAGSLTALAAFAHPWVRREY